MQRNSDSAQNWLIFVPLAKLDYEMVPNISRRTLTFVSILVVKQLLPEKQTNAALKLSEILSEKGSWRLKIEIENYIYK